MKKTLTILLLTLTSAFANNVRPSSIPLILNDVAIEVIDDGKLVHQEMICEDKTCLINGTRVHLKFRLSGCLDRLGPVSYTAHQKGGLIDLKVSAYNIVNSDSFAAFCFAMPEEIVTIDLFNYYGRVELSTMRTVIR